MNCGGRGWQTLMLLPLDVIKSKCNTRGDEPDDSKAEVIEVIC